MPINTYSRCQCLKDAPWNAHQDKANQKHFDALNEENDEDQTSDQGERTNHRLLETNTICNPTVQHETKNFTNICSVRETGLPCSCQVV
jgi:hypothetical protein